MQVTAQFKIKLDEIRTRPLEETAVLWRYQTIERFQQTIENRGLYFTHPTEFVDPNEGATTKGSLNELIMNAAQQFREQSGLQILNADGIAFTVRAFFISLCYASESLVNCWHRSEFESSLMWNSYTNESGVVLKSNVKLLKAAVAKHGGILIPMEYFNYKNPKKEIHPHDAYFYKQNEFESEKEVRAFILDNKKFANKVDEVFKTVKPKLLTNEEKMRPPEKDEPRLQFSHGDTWSFKHQKPNPTLGKYYDFEIGEVVEEIIMHPNSNESDFLKVQGILKSNNLNIPIAKSKLATKLNNRFY